MRINVHKLLFLYGKEAENYVMFAYIGTSLSIKYYERVDVHA